MKKRFLDLLLSVPALFLLSPFFFLIAVWIVVDSRGPVFFKQERIGRNFRPFRIYKFRTMVKDAENRGPSITFGGDGRITRFGGLLRRTKIDELPQLINVVRGDMSLVGPRPEVKKYVDYYSSDYREILRVRPGISDVASVKFRDEESLLKAQEDPETYYREVHLPRKIQMAREYVENASPLYDLRIILRTIQRVLRLGEEGKEGN